MLKSAWARDWLYYGQHLTASAVYGRELYASQDMAFYGVICVAFPIIGAIMGTGSASGNGQHVTGPLPGSGGPGGPPGPGEPEPVPDPPTGGRLTNAGARTALRPAEAGPGRTTRVGQGWVGCVSSYAVLSGNVPGTVRA